MTVRDKQPLDQMLAGCTHASLVPTQLWRLLVNNTPVTLKAVLLGGAAIPVELTEQAREQGIRCFYGLCERGRWPGGCGLCFTGAGSQDR